MGSQSRRSLLLVPFVAISLGVGLARAGDGVWTPVGPGASWSSNEITVVAIHPASPGSVWVAMPHGGLYRSLDKGTDWSWAGGPFQSPQVGGLPVVAADPSRPAALWAATATGVFRTENGGRRWARLSDASYRAALADGSPQALAAPRGALYVLTSRRLLASSDGGRSWESLVEQDSMDGFAAASADVLYLASGGALQQSVDGGRTWAAVTSCPRGVQRIAPAPAAVYVAVGGEAAGLLRSTDQGRTWRPVLGGTPDHPFDVVSIAVDPHLPRIVYVAGGDGETSGLWISRNAGRAWTQAGGAAPGQLQIDSASGTLYGSDGRRVLRSVDGGRSWTTVLRAPDSSSSETAHLRFRPGDPAHQALAVGDTLYRSLDGGASWKLSNALPGIYDVDLDPASPSRLIAATSSAIYLSENFGQSWTRAASGDLWYLESLERVDARTLLAGGVGIYRSGDDGRTWQNVLNGWPFGQASDVGRWTQKIAVDPVHPWIAYALTFQGSVDSLPHGPLADYHWPSILWRSTDGGRTWKKALPGLRAFAVDAASGRLYVVLDRRLSMSDDGGTTWRRVGRMPNEAYDLLIDPARSDTLYTVPTLWRSRDGGATWGEVDERFSPAALAVDPRDPRILYGADRYRVSTLTDLD